jgi:hypothetical protein
MGGKIVLPFCSAYYFNTDDRDMVRRVIIKAARIAEERNAGALVSSGRSVYGGDGHFNVDDADDVFVGLFYLDVKDDIYTRKFSILTPSLDFGYHKYFFEDLVKGGVLGGGDYEAYPRGFTFYDKSNRVYVVVGGEYLTRSLGEDVCREFGYDCDKYPWVLIESPIYTYKNMGFAGA